VAVHAKNTLRCPCIAEILNPSLAVSAFEAIGAKCLVARQNGQIFDFISARAAAVGAVVAD
jgi:hypothetical protein